MKLTFLLVCLGTLLTSCDKSTDQTKKEQPAFEGKYFLQVNTGSTTGIAYLEMQTVPTLDTVGIGLNWNKTTATRDAAWKFTAVTNNTYTIVPMKDTTKILIYHNSYPFMRVVPANGVSSSSTLFLVLPVKDSIFTIE